VYLENGRDVNIQDVAITGDTLQLIGDFANEDPLWMTYGEEKNEPAFYSLKDNHFMYGGGFHILNMEKMSKFTNVSFHDLIAERGDCIFVGLHSNYRLLGYNEEPYNFQNLNLRHCKA